MQYHCSQTHLKFDKNLYLRYILDSFALKILQRENPKILDKTNQIIYELYCISLKGMKLLKNKEK